VTQVEQVERRAGRPRSEEADRAIIDATLDLLAEVGVGPLSIEGVAARAGVGKATVYRRWPNKDALIVDAMAALKGPVPVPAGRSLREDMTILFNNLARGHEAARQRRIYACFVGEVGRHPDLVRRYVEAVIEPRREVMRGVLRAAIARGELRDDLDIELMLHLITAPVLHWTVHDPDHPLDVELMQRFLDATLEGLAPRSLPREA
jgi:AcrR family transcriptional regulator